MRTREMTVRLKVQEDKKVTMAWVAERLAAYERACNKRRVSGYPSDVYEFLGVDPDNVFYSWAGVCYIDHGDGKVEYHANAGAGFSTPEKAIAAIRRQAEDDLSLADCDVILVASDNVYNDFGHHYWYSDADDPWYNEIIDRLWREPSPV